jgi:hypothetical protein
MSLSLKGTAKLTHDKAQDPLSLVIEIEIDPQFPPEIEMLASFKELTRKLGDSFALRLSYENKDYAEAAPAVETAPIVEEKKRE